MDFLGEWKYNVHFTTRVGQNHTFIGIYGVYTVFLAGKSPYIRSNTVCIYGSGQPYSLHMCMYTRKHSAVWHHYSHRHCYC